MILGLLVLLAGIGTVLVTQVFTVKKVTVVGNEIYTDDQIREFFLFLLLNLHTAS